jgi:2'-5' RNA ligase
MNSLVIVALPADDDIVWKVSSEKVPHLTLLYLGEYESDDNVQRMADFVEHALNISEHGPFYLDVDHRGELGPDKADVLFFTGGWDSKWIKSLRGQLLQQNDIRAEYEEAMAAGDGFPDWVPHLTLGYPTAPAKPIPDDRKIYSVQFDRVAVWTGDYSGPEFRLKWPERDLMESPALAYSEIGEAAVADILGHSGVKGMKWGRRKSEISHPKSVMTTGQKIAVGAGGALAFVHKPTLKAYQTDQANLKGFQADKKWEKDFNKAKSFRYDDAKFTSSYNKKFEKEDFSKEDWNNPSKKYQQYIDGYFHEMNKDYAKQFAAHYGSSPSGNYRAVHVKATNEVKIQRADAAQHSLEDGVLVTFRVNVDDQGMITGLETVDNTLEQGASLVEDILSHHGVKGMRWGVRKEQLTSGAKTAAKATGKAAKATGKALGRAADDVNFELGASRDATHHEIMSRAHGKLKGDLPALKEKHPVGGKLKNRMKDPLSSESRAYRKDVKQTYLKHLESSANEITNLRGTRRYTLKEYGRPNTSKHFWHVSTEAVQHDAVSGTFKVRPMFDDEGYINDIAEITEDEALAQSMEEGETFILSHQSVLDNPTLKDLIKAKLQDILEDVTGSDNNDEDLNLFGDPLIRTKLQSVLQDFYKDPNVDNVAVYDALGSLFLEHYGVKGMRWGLRRKGEAPAAVAPKAMSRVPHGDRRKTKIDTEGGQNHPAHADAIKVAQAQAKLKKSGASALSNQELRDVATRVQLENQVSLLTGHRGKQYVRRHLETAGNQQVQRGLARGIATGAAKKGGKAALLFA